MPGQVWKFEELPVLVGLVDRRLRRRCLRPLFCASHAAGQIDSGCLRGRRGCCLSDGQSALF